MKRGKKIIFVSHCLLNVNVKVMGLAAHPGVLKPLVCFLMDHDTAMVQLPCPETEILGLCRWGHVKDQLAYPFFKDHCRRLLAPFIRQIRMYRKNGYRLKGVIGIDGSPSCGVHKTCRSRQWSGDFLDKEDTWKKIQDLEWCAEPGIFMEIFQNMLMENNLSLDFFAVDETNTDISLSSLLQTLSPLLKG
jgi:predicted secreted protein